MRDWSSLSDALIASWEAWDDIYDTDEAWRFTSRLYARDLYSTSRGIPSIFD